MGGAYVLLQRGASIHKTQEFTGHDEIRTVMMYGMMMQQNINFGTIVDMSKPSIGDAYELRSTQALLRRLLDSYTVVEMQKNHIDTCKAP